MLNSVEIWSNDISKSKLKGKKNQALSYEMFGTSLQGKKLEGIMTDALDGRVLETDTYWHFYALACPIKNVNKGN